jgi:anti-sigma factor RsiW
MRPHLELLMNDQNLGDDDVRALLSDHFEGALDEPMARRVQQALNDNPALAFEYQQLQQTVQALRALPPHEAPPQLVSAVRRRLADERRAATTPAASDDAVVSVRGGFGGLWGLAVAGACVALLAVVVVVGPGGSDADISTAGLGAHTAVVVQFSAPGLVEAEVVAWAQNAGLAVVPDTTATFRGDATAAGRLLLQLKTEGARQGVEVAGRVPGDSSDVVVVVKLQP